MGASDLCWIVATNRLFRPCPDLALAAGYSYAQLEVPADETLYIAQSDIKDYFYSLGLPEDLQKFFCLPPLNTAELRAAGVPAECLPDSSNAYPTFIVVPMGWSWAMWLAQRTHQHQAAIACNLDISRVIVDGRPSPSLSDGEPAILPYADNLNVVGTDKSRVQKTKDIIVAHLRKLGFLVHEELDATDYAVSLGFLIDGKKGIVRPNPAKLGKVILCLEWLSSRPRVSGKIVERLIGHCVHFFMLRRELLSLFRSLYDFKATHLHHRTRLWTSASVEAGWAADLSESVLQI